MLEKQKIINSIQWCDFTLSSENSALAHIRELADYRLYHLTALTKNKAAANRFAMANVFASLTHSNTSVVYILSGHPQGVDLYIGVAANDMTADLPEAGRTLKSAFEGNFLGASVADIKRENASIQTLYQQTRHLGLVTGVPSFNEANGSMSDEEFQGVERLASSINGEYWQLTIVATPSSDRDIQNTLEQIYSLSTDISAHIKQSVQHSEGESWQRNSSSSETTSFTKGSNTSQTESKNTSSSDTEGKNSSGSTAKTEGKSRGNSSDTSSNTGTTKTKSDGKSESKTYTRGNGQSNTTGENHANTEGNSQSYSYGKSANTGKATTHEIINKRFEEVQKYISETLIDRFKRGRSKGMYQVSCYVSARTQATYDRLASGVMSLFQGNQSTMTPLKVHTLSVEGGLTLQQLVEKKQFTLNKDDQLKTLLQSIPVDLERQSINGATWLNSKELSLMAGLPTKELPGVIIRESVDFALNTPTTQQSDIPLGCVIHHGRQLKNQSVGLAKSELAKHIFITGVTGSGKTTTSMKLLLSSGMPFMVIEPAKTEYRALYEHDYSVEYYVLGNENLTQFRLNPFELVSAKSNLFAHITTLSATLQAVFPMEAAMPAIVEEAIILAYKHKGWNINNNVNYFYDDPWCAGSQAWPTFTDMIRELQGVIESKGMGQEFQEKYQGSLVARLTNLTLGTKGIMLNTRQSIDFDALLDKRVVIELDELKDEKDKALFMGLIISRLAECVKHRHAKDSDFRHLTLIEEAHHLLSRVDGGEGDTRKLALDMFCNLLAEVRKYGEGLIIADQIPNKLVPDVLKNTNTKIVHRLFAADDRNAIGDTMGLDDEQKDFLPKLLPGETVIFSGGWHAPVRVQIDQIVKTDVTPVCDDILKSQGQKQLWQQRETLYPHLASVWQSEAAGDFASLIRIGKDIIMMALHIYKQRLEIVDMADLQMKAAEAGFSRMLKRYQVAYNQLQAEFGGSLPDLLAQLFLDISNDYEEEDELHYQECLPQLFTALSVSLMNVVDLESSNRNIKNKLSVLQQSELV